MNKKTKQFRDRLLALKGKTTIFREYAHVAAVNILDVTTSDEEFSITFKLIGSKPKAKPVTIGSVWSNTTVEMNGFAISYVGSQMLTEMNAIAEFQNKITPESSDREKQRIFTRLLTASPAPRSDYGSMNNFKITKELTLVEFGQPEKTIWTFEQKATGWKTSKTEFFENESGKSRKKQNTIVSPRSIEKFVSTLETIKIPVILPFEMGCDGEFTELEYGDYDGGMKFRWWSFPPKGLEKLDKAVETLLEEIVDD